MRLKEHERIHIDQNPSVAPIVTNNLWQSVRLKEHERIHSDENPFNCTHFDREFALEVRPKEHDRRIHIDEKYSVANSVL